MKESFALEETFAIDAASLYKAWLDSSLHSQMTGGDAHCSTVEGESHSAWDGYITGKNVELIENKKIVQTWRTTEFDETDEDSILTIQLFGVPEGTKLSLTHTNIPKGQTQYEQGWIDHYFSPMKEFFSSQV